MWGRAMAAIVGGMMTVMAGAAPLEIANPRVEYLTEPLGLGTTAPRFYWEVASSERGAKQSAYQIRVGTPEAVDAAALWDSGKVASDATIHVAYGGEALAATTVYGWQVRVWNEDDEASDWSAPQRFGIGPLTDSDWSGLWIEGPPLWPAGQHKAHNGHKSEPTIGGDAPSWVRVDLGAARSIDRVTLYPAAPYDVTPRPSGYLFPVRYRIETADDEAFANPTVVVDATQADVANPGDRAVVHRFDPVTARYVRLVVTRKPAVGRGYAFALAQFEVYSGATNVSAKKAVTASDAAEGTWSAKSLTNGVRVSRPDQSVRNTACYIRKEFDAPKTVARATAYVSALGVYELRINGDRIGDRILAPEWTDYTQRVQYQAYDVTDALKEGRNAVGVVLGDGWYAGQIGLAEILDVTPWFGVYGTTPKVCADIRITYSDGSVDTLATDDSWKCSWNGPIQENDLLDGEHIDATKSIDGWDQPGFDAAAWFGAWESAGVAVARVAQPNEPIRVTEEFPAVTMTEPASGVYVYDLGQNIQGWCRITAAGAPGETMTIRHGEVLNDDGSLYTTNLRAADQTDRYTFASDQPETFEPHFTYHGFRFVEITGVAHAPAAKDVIGRAFHSDAPLASTFECSDPMVNQLAKNIAWTLRDNLISVPTDCPQRDERMGWTGDIQVFAPTAIYTMDMAAFFTKWLQDLRDAQADDGRFPDFAPHPFGKDERFTGVPAWGDAGTFVPWHAYVAYGDVALVRAHYDAAKAWIEYIDGKNPDHLWKEGRGNNYNDWLNSDTFKFDLFPKEGGAVPPDILATAFFYESTRMVADMAKVIGNDSDAKQYGALAESIRDAFRSAFIAADGKMPGDTQAGYALALHFDLMPDALADAAIAHLVAGMDRYDGHLSTGFQTTPAAMLELSKHGKNDIAYRLLLNRTFPSWGFQIEHGATTMWERWDGYVPDVGFQDPGMNSFNHYALGSVGEWMWKTIIGIQPAYHGETPNAYKRFVIAPKPCGGLTWAKGNYDSIRGPIAVGWTIDGQVLTVDVRVPANTEAVVVIPNVAADAVREGSNSATQSTGVAGLRSEDGNATFLVQSGSYRFSVDLPDGWSCS